MERERLREIVEGSVREVLDSLPQEPPRNPRFNFRKVEYPMALVMANWKMHMDLAGAEAFAREMLGTDVSKAGAGIAPPMYILPALAKALNGTGIMVGAQNMHPEDEGAFTGEHSPLMLKDAGAEFVILGHSERRHVFGENDEFINQKVKSALQHSLNPILCVGEKLEERESHRTFAVVGKQLMLGLKGVSVNEASPLVIAYEPVWAIGTGLTASPEQAQEVHQFIRDELRGILDPQLAKDCRILYGGSVKPANAVQLIEEKDIDGFLVGGASLKAESFREIIDLVGTNI